MKKICWYISSTLHVFSICSVCVNVIMWLRNEVEILQSRRKDLKTSSRDYEMSHGCKHAMLKKMGVVNPEH